MAASGNSRAKENPESLDNALFLSFSQIKMIFVESKILLNRINY